MTSTTATTGGSESLAVAWGVQLANSAVIGPGVGLILAPRVTGPATGLRLGAAYGLAGVVGPRAAAADVGCHGDAAAGRRRGGLAHA